MIVVIADDLSGAAELAGAALRHGLSAEVQTDFHSGSPAEVVCVDTDTRLLPPEQAAERVAAVVRNVIAARPAWIFKKCDSVLRGPVLAEARATARAAGLASIVILPANPSRHRVIRAGGYFIDGRPLHQSSFAHDPIHPRSTSQVVELLDGDLTGVITPDAQSTADMAKQAAAVGRDTLPVGAADFFTAVLEARVPHQAKSFSEPATHSSGPALLVCGSAATWSQRHAEAKVQSIPVFALPHDIGAVVGALQTSGRALIGIGDGLGQSSTVLTGKLAESVAEILRATSVSRLLLEGGATAAAVVRTLGWTRLRACEVSPQGVGVLQPVSQSGPLVFIKPGSYAWPSQIWLA